MAGVINNCKKCGDTIWDEQTINMLCDKCAGTKTHRPQMDFKHTGNVNLGSRHGFLQGSAPSDHPAGDVMGDLFSSQRAAYYLDLDSVRTLEMFERDFGLKGQIIGKRKMYHKAHLDEAARKAFGIKKG